MGSRGSHSHGSAGQAPRGGREGGRRRAVSASSQHAERVGRGEGRGGETPSVGHWWGAEPGRISVLGLGSRYLGGRLRSLVRILTPPSLPTISWGSQMSPHRAERGPGQEVSGSKELPVSPRAYSWSGENWVGWGDTREAGGLRRQAQAMCLGAGQAGC